MTISVEPGAITLSVRRRLSRALLRRSISVGVVAALGAGVWALATGVVALVTINGASMEPVLQTGDLVIVRPSSSYAVGDIVAFRSAELGHVVVHRIIDRDDEGFLLQGDGNSWVDLGRPSSEEVIGRMAVHVPVVGRALTAVRHPVALVALGLALGLTFVVRRPAEDDAPDG